MKNEGKTALVLSAGGLYCAWQAGAWKAIEKSAPPELVVGASAGALNGWPIAGGCTAESLIERWLDRGTSDVLHLIENYGLARGYFDPEPLRAQTEKIVAEFQPVIPFGLTLVEVPRFRTVLVRSPKVTAKHLQATCAIPMVLPSVVIDGVRYVDGGLIEKIPVNAAADMGATHMIVLDSFPEVDLWWLRWGAMAMRTLARKRRPGEEVEITVIAPSEPLGDANSAVFWKRENIERWIELGYRDAMRALRETRPVRLAGEEPEGQWA